jgi:cyclic beta-1,2-glucan synthetase
VAPGLQALVFERTRGWLGERALMAAHFRRPAIRSADIRVWPTSSAGLGTTRREPALVVQAAPAADEQAVALDTGLDPVCALAVRLRIAMRRRC